MRLKNIKQYYLKNKVVHQDAREGGRYETFSAPISIMANIYIAEPGTSQPTARGIDNKDVREMLLDVDYQVQYDVLTKQVKYVFAEGALSVGDGVCVYAPPEQEPDYQIVSVAEAGHLICQLEKC